jgi:L-threonylcarbamoyladenylate synthase
MIEEILKATEVLKNGGVLLYATDTIWGIGCDASNAEAVKKVYAIKKRDEAKSLIVLVDNHTRLERTVYRKTANDYLRQT